MWISKELWIFEKKKIQGFLEDGIGWMIKQNLNAKKNKVFF